RGQRHRSRRHPDLHTGIAVLHPALAALQHRERHHQRDGVRPRLVRAGDGVRGRPLGQVMSSAPMTRTRTAAAVVTIAAMLLAAAAVATRAPAPASAAGFQTVAYFDQWSIYGNAYYVKNL